jgi:DNA repair exonuclease SbcCD ATPase subunit
VNSVNDKDTVVEVEFTIGKNEYQVMRAIKPNKLEISVNGQLFNQEAAVNDQQKNFEKNVLKMNFKSFTQVVILGASTFVPFMRMPLGQRREIIEDILDIQIFSTMNDNLRAKVKINNEELREIDYQLELVKNKIAIQKEHMLNLEKRDKEEIDRKKQKIVEYEQKETENSDIITNLTQQILRLNEEMLDYKQSSKKLTKLNTYLMKLTHKLNSIKKEHKFFEDNHVCPTCTQTLEDTFREEKISSGKNKIQEMEEGFDELNNAIEEEQTRVERFNELSTEISDLNSQVTQTNYEITSIRKAITDINNEIDEIHNDNADAKAEYSKLKVLVSDKKDLSVQLDETRKDKDTLSVASKLLKDSGIKTRIIKTYLPTMNKMIAHYLGNMEFYVNFTLDENFEETIKSRYRDVFSYESFSEGEKARIDIALLLTWRSIAKLKNSVDTNLLILDEIFDGSLDQSGTSELGWILRNFDDRTNVFVISHKEAMSDKFERTLIVEKPKNFSTLREY